MNRVLRFLRELVRRLVVASKAFSLTLWYGYSIPDPAAHLVLPLPEGGAVEDRHAFTVYWKMRDGRQVLAMQGSQGAAARNRWEESKRRPEVVAARFLRGVEVCSSWGEW